MNRVDVAAVRTGAFVAISLCLPVAIVADLIVDEDSSSQPAIVYVLFLAVLLGLATGGFAAAKETDSPYSSGAIAALVAFVAIQLVGVIAHAIRGESIEITQIVGTGLLAYGCGLLGAAVEVRRRKLTT